MDFKTTAYHIEEFFGIRGGSGYFKSLHPNKLNDRQAWCCLDLEDRYSR